MKKIINTIKELSAKINFALFRTLVFLCPLILTLVAIKSFAANQITGTVFDAETNAPLKNALVSLKSTGDLVLTNENGAFTLTKTAVSIINVKQAVPAAPFTIQKNNLQLTISTPNTMVQLIVMNINGQIIYKTAKTFQPGSHNIDLSKTLSMNSTHIVQLKINKTNYTTKVLPLAIRLSGNPIVSCPAVRPSGRLAVISSDTLLVSKYLYTPQTTPVTATISVLLQKPATPPTPPGMKPIPGGTFMRGSNRPFSDNDEQPIKEITITSFYIDSTEVTQADYIALLHTEPWLKYGMAASSFIGCGNNYPVWNINWYDAALYCNARSKRDGLDTVYIYDAISGIVGDSCILENVKTDFDKNGYRLPTEAEWEYAARSGTTTDYYWGNYSKVDLETPLKYAWYATNIAHPVALKIPNNFGLFDMSGNVFEFVNDFYHGSAYNSVETIDPKGPLSYDGRRGQRGGGWDALIDEIRSSGRVGIHPYAVVNWNGFRVALPNK